MLHIGVILLETDDIRSYVRVGAIQTVYIYPDSKPW